MTTQPTTGKTTQPTIGKNIDSYCGRCKLLLAHTIEVVAAGKVTRVECNTCGALHAYRPKAPGKRAAAGAAGLPAPSEYEKLMRSQDPSKAKPYSMGERFKQTDLIKHPTFGLGLVIGRRETSKIEVLFGDGIKVLVHGR